MRIALFTETYLPYVNGVVTHIKSLKEGLEQLGHQVLVVTADPNAKRFYIEDGVLRCPAKASKRLYGYGVANPISTKRIQMIRQFKPDIIHIHQEFGIGFSGVTMAKLYDIAMVYTLHTMYDEYIYYIAPQPLAPMTQKAADAYIKMIAKNAQALTGPSKKCEEYLRRTGVYKPVEVIPNPVDLDTFNPDKISHEQTSDVRKKLGFECDMLVGAFLGRLGREKSVDKLLDYWKQTISPAQNVRLLIIGDGPCRAELEEQCVRSGISDMIVFAGKVLHEDVAPYLGACDFYITASTSDTNSISMLEGMAMGLPVLQITDPLNEGQVIDGINGFVFNSAQEMADVIHLLQTMPATTMEALRHSARKSVEKSGSIDLARYVLKVYRSALREKKRKRLLRHITMRHPIQSLQQAHVAQKLAQADKVGKPRPDTPQKKSGAPKKEREPKKFFVSFKKGTKRNDHKS